MSDNAIDVVLVTKYTWRGQARTTSNKWHFTGTAIADLPTATNLANAIAAIQANFYAGQYSETIPTAYVYNPGSKDADFIVNGMTQSHSGATNLNGSTAVLQPEVCTLLEHSDGVDSKGRTKYLRKWMHFTMQPGSASSSVALSTAGVAAVGTLTSGGIGEHNWLTCAPDGTELTGAWTVRPSLYTRQLREGSKKS